jgi:hypothetical protein
MSNDIQLEILKQLYLKYPPQVTFKPLGCLVFLSYERKNNHIPKSIPHGLQSLIDELSFRYP